MTYVDTFSLVCSPWVKRTTFHPLEQDVDTADLVQILYRLRHLSKLCYGVALSRLLADKRPFYKARYDVSVSEIENLSLPKDHLVRVSQVQNGMSRSADAGQYKLNLARCDGAPSRMREAWGTRRKATMGDYMRRIL